MTFRSADDAQSLRKAEQQKQRRRKQQQKSARPKPTFILL